MDALADRVRHERLRRGWSVRDAAAAGGISNTYWGQFEDYKQPLTPTIAAAVARAFDWEDTWPDENVSQSDEPGVQLLRIEGTRQIQDLTERVLRLEDAHVELEGVVAELLEAVRRRASGD